MKKLLLTFLFVNFLNTYAQNPIQEFNFNGNLTSADNTISFLGSPVFVNDRFGTAKSALRLTNKALQAVVGDLPQGNKPRTISVWVKFNTVAAVNYILGYGTALGGQFFGLSQQAAIAGNSDLSLVGWETVNNVTISVPLAKEVWYLYSITYDGNTSKVYRNGVLLKAVDGIQRATKGYILNLGKINTTTGINADIDDVRIYTVAMTDEQVKESYESSKAAATISKVTEAATAQNAIPKTSSNGKIQSPVASTVDPNKAFKNIEVFSQGKKIMDTNGTNIGDLPEGTYLIKLINTSPKK